MLKNNISSFSNSDFMILSDTFGKKFYVLREQVLYEYLSESYFNAHQDSPSNVYNLHEYSFLPDQNGIIVQPKDSKKSVKGTLMESKNMTQCLDWIQNIEYNLKRRDLYYLSIIRSQKKIIQANHQNSECDMQSIVEQDLKTNSSANQTMIYDQNKHFKGVNEAWLKKCVDQFIVKLNNNPNLMKHKKKNTELDFLKEILNFNQTYLHQNNSNIIGCVDSIMLLLNSQLVEQFYKREHIRSLIKSKIYYTNYSFVLHHFISKYQGLILYQVEIMNIQSAKKLLCQQEELIRSGINDVELVVQTFLDDINTSYSFGISENVKYTLNKVFKFFLNEIECVCTYIMYFISELIPTIYSLSQINFLIQSLKNHQNIHYINLGQLTIDILESAKNPQENSEKIEQIFNSLCSRILIQQNQLSERMNRMNSMNFNASALDNILEEQQ